MIGVKHHGFETIEPIFIKSLKLALFYPDYDLPWAVRADASDIGVGGILIQERTAENGVVTEEVIKVVHQKFSGSAKCWAVIKKEA